MKVLINFPTENNVLALFTRIWIKTHFPFLTLWLILAKSLLSSAATLSVLCITEIKEVSSSNNLAIHDNSSASSFMYIEKVTPVGFLR